MTLKLEDISCVIPAKNEAPTIAAVVAKAVKLGVGEVIVVNDGSTDDTALVAEREGARVISHPYSKGNGAAIKTGIRAATCDCLAFLDADGQHDPGWLGGFLDAINSGADMVVGARTRGGQASLGRHLANSFYNRTASLLTGQHVQDLTSGFRVARAEAMREFMGLYPNKFSYPTTSTMAFFRAGYTVRYLPIPVAAREGKSHISPVRDGVRFLLIIFKVATLYSPLKVFVPLSAAFFSSGVLYYAYTFAMSGRFTNFGNLLLVTSVLVFLIGLVSEQITALMYKD